MIFQETVWQTGGPRTATAGAQAQSQKSWWGKCHYEANCTHKPFSFISWWVCSDRTHFLSCFLGLWDTAAYIWLKVRFSMNWPSKATRMLPQGILDWEENYAKERDQSKYSSCMFCLVCSFEADVCEERVIDRLSHVVLHWKEGWLYFTKVTLYCIN